MNELYFFNHNYKYKIDLVFSIIIRQMKEYILTYLKGIIYFDINVYYHYL